MKERERCYSFLLSQISHDVNKSSHSLNLDLNELTITHIFINVTFSQCPESSTKQDLLAYLQRIALYCHQIQITSKVKADVQNISGELIVSGVRLRDGQVILSLVQITIP
jgi:predicted metalloenzyme YecM